MATSTKPNKAAFMKAGTPAEAAKILGHNDGGKRFRARLRTLAGKAVDNPKRFDAATKAKLWDIFVEGKQAAKAAPKKSGGNAKQRRTTKRAEKAKEETPKVEA